MTTLRALLVACTVLASGCAGAVHGLFPPREGEPVESVYVVSHGWHTGIALRTRDIPAGAWPQARAFTESEFLEVGWGDRDFYMAPVPTSGMAVKAALAATPSVLHVVGFSGPVERFFPTSDIVGVRLSRQGFDQLVAFIQDAHAPGEPSAAPALGPGQYANSSFFPARERYHLFRTCNVWTARALRSGGCPITPLYAVTAGNVIYQAMALCGGTRVGPRARDGT